LLYFSSRRPALYHKLLVALQNIGHFILAHFLRHVKLVFIFDFDFNLRLHLSQADLVPLVPPQRRRRAKSSLAKLTLDYALTVHGKPVLFQAAFCFVSIEAVAALELVCFLVIFTNF